MLLPTASTAQAGAGIQLILRQQPAQQQVLTIQTPQGPATINAQGQAQAGSGKNIVRYVSQVPQLAQVCILFFSLMENKIIPKVTIIFILTYREIFFSLEFGIWIATDSNS